ncbi:iron reductase domain protein [Cucurbitaria berberidis CBS 394.84]|uniref:Iron reductase domain protein n=1 Tax=Cucurbitaria berberidis CBS 394.84 TaxID=1168544 RepID=A0A9P4GPV8_9PLEO|nr:iron reductase domain protein [Cucurbitaria berberidis CBS 394.84]KAF1849144.1 iron reductase domain protein [Cucurbitaria berberidis CBS 394.84]
MLSLRARFGALAALVAFFPVLIAAQNTNATAASTFFLSETETQFSVNIANDSSDVFIYFTSPAYSWVGVGFGAKMENSLMFIMYPDADGNNVTISPRLGSKASEPTFSPNVAVEILPGTQINDSMLILHARCRNCRVWPNGFLDTKTDAHPMIYAFGHGNRLYSDSPSAGLKRHIRYGHFTMDMVAATGEGRVPSKSAVSGVRIGGEMVRDHDRANLAHAIVGCLALFLIWPLNVIFAGFFKNIKIHIGVSVVVMAFLLVAYALGGVTSAQYNRSKSFNSPHQITAFISLLPILLISILPLPSVSKLHAKIPSLHTPLTSVTFVLLVLTGGLGLHLSSQARPVILGYTAVALMVFVFNTVLQTCIRRRGSAHARAANRKTPGETDDDRDLMLGKMVESRSTSSTSLGAGGAPPAYGAPYYGRGENREFGADGQQQRSPGRVNGYGGGTMPGPQYLLNMHPGVPVQVSRM